MGPTAKLNLGNVANVSHCYAGFRGSTNEWLAVALHNFIIYPSYVYTNIRHLNGTILLISDDAPSDDIRKDLCFTANVLFYRYTFSLAARAEAHRQRYIRGSVLG